MRLAVAMSAVLLSAVVLATAACSGSPAGAPASGPARPAASSAARSPASSPAGFTVAGVKPVPRNGSQDTGAQGNGASCDSATLSSDQRLGGEIAGGFAATGLPASAHLLRHFLAGSGTAVGYPPGSRVSLLAAASAAFHEVSLSVQAAVARQLKAGATRVRLSAWQLPLVSFGSAQGDLYWGFRGTQGLTVTGRGSRASGIFTGTLTFVIRDSYGFPAGDVLGGFGAPMRYLQTVCGAPQHAGGARWFPDSITVTVPLRVPA
jgi:hypothetical protein